MPQQHPLTINVNDQLTIDAGSWQECVEEDQTPYRLISSPQTAMYRQALSYLEEATKDMKAPAKSRLHFGEVAIATVAVCLRWGSYFAVLAKHDLPQWAAAFDPEASCIGDGEMARINIEASAALSDWIDLMQADQSDSASWSRPPSNSSLSPSRISTGRRITSASGRWAPSIPSMADAP